MPSHRSRQRESILINRLERFHGFYASLSRKERIAINRKLTRWCDVINSLIGSDHFSINAARELFMAVMENGGFKN